jgi:predicted metal-binding membrane protein
VPSSRSPVAVTLRRENIVIVACAVVVIGLASAYLLRLRSEMSIETTMDMHMPWSSADVLLAGVMWSVMMIGMMAGSATPVVMLYAGAEHARPRRSRFALAGFVLGYFVVWGGFSVCAALAQWGLHESLALSTSMVTSSPRVGGAILLIAGAYQLTSLKAACLAHCQSPLGFLMAHWRDGSLGAFRMGARHGLYCLGCCWALMLVLFVVGVMNLAWIAALAAFVFVEKLGIAPRAVSRAAGVVLIVAGVALIAT